MLQIVLCDTAQACDQTRFDLATWLNVIPSKKEKVMKMNTTDKNKHSIKLSHLHDTQRHQPPHK